MSSKSKPKPEDWTPAPLMPTWDLGRVTKIEIENYRGIRGKLDLDLPKGENLLVYGENGAGKSSVFHAIRDFLESAEREHFDREKMAWRKLRPDDFVHRFTTEKARVSLHFGTHEIAWSASEDGPAKSEARDLDKGKGFLDYKALQRVHLLERQALEVDLFPLVIDHLLPHYPNTASAGKMTFSQQWSDILNRNAKPRKGEPRPVTQAEVDEFNAGFEPEITNLSQNATTLLEVFGGDTAVSLRYQMASLKPAKKGDTKLVLHPPRLLALPSLRRLALPDYESVLNEARLSALAVCLFFAALKSSPSTSLRLLALDDILIGLDMSNRVKVIDLVHSQFKEWQVVILTYSKAWFERLKDRLTGDGWAAPWKAVVLFEDHREDETSPRIIVEDCGNRLEMAAAHLRKKDYHGAAVYARIALEDVCHHACAKRSIPVPHVEMLKHRKLEHFLDALEGRSGELRDDATRRLALRLLTRVREAKSFVLNRNAHFDIEDEDVLSGEVGSAIVAVKEFGEFLESQQWAKANFDTGRSLPPAERLAASISAARESAALCAIKQALGALSQAHDAFWDVYGSLLGVMFRVGDRPQASEIWKAAKEQSLLPAGVDARLNPLRPYLFGTVKSKDFNLVSFSEAARALEDLSVIKV